MLAPAIPLGSARERVPHRLDLQHLRRQYLYFCTSKASKLSTRSETAVKVHADPIKRRSLPLVYC